MYSLTNARSAASCRRRWRLPASLVLLLLAPAAAGAFPPRPAPPQTRPVAIVDATIHTASGPVIERGTIVFRNGRIEEVGQNVRVPRGAERIDGRGKHVYPGLFDASTQLGLTEITSVRATNDFREAGSINPNARAIVAVNPDSDLIPVTRSNGVTTALTVPSGGLLSGTSAVIRLDGWTWEEMALAPDAALHIAWPRMTALRSRFSDEPDDEQLRRRDRELKTLRDTFADARAYWQARLAAERDEARLPRTDARWEAMIPIFERALPVIVEADEARQIQAAVAFAEREGIRLIIVGGYDAPDCAELLKKHDVPVIVLGVHRLPLRRHEPYDTPYTVAQRLHAAGVRYCIAGNDRMGNARNLPYQAATAAAYGLSVEEALRAITLYPAQILGLGERLGSLDAGKAATLVLATGDPLDIRSQVEAVYIDGRQLDLADRHKALDAKYREKYRRLGLDGALAE
jgi:imidazolonepropionase-like amidohydrolase